MKSTVLSCGSKYGKFMASTRNEAPRTSTTLTTISLKQNYTHQRPFIMCKHDIRGNRLYLLDNKGFLVCVNLHDCSFSTLQKQNIQNYTIDGNNSLSLLYVNGNSELYRVSFENKKSSKIMNLNMSRILAFERNYLRDMLLVLDYKWLLLCDLTNPSKIKSVKATYNETFTNSCFGCDNRFIILATKNIHIKILEIVDLKAISEIDLPFAVDNLQIQVSYDSRKIAIYGNCNIIFFIKINEHKDFTYELIEIPFLKYIQKLKYTYNHQIVLLGNDQIMYVIDPDTPTRAKILFNADYQVKLMNFDVSLDCKKIAIISNRTVYGLKFKHGLRSAIKELEEWRPIEYRENGFNFQNVEPTSSQPEQDTEPEPKQYQYDEEQQQEQVYQHCSHTLQLSRLKPIIIHPINSELMQHEIEKLPLKQEPKKHLNNIYTHLISHYREVTMGEGEHVLNFLLCMHEMCGENWAGMGSLCDYVYRNVSECVERLEEYGVVFCPEVVSVIGKRFSLDFNQFFKSNVMELYLQYFPPEEHIKLLNYLIDNLDDHDHIPLTFVAVLQEQLAAIEQGNESWEELIHPTNLHVHVDQVCERVSSMTNKSKYKQMLMRKDSRQPQPLPSDEPTEPAKESKERGVDHIFDGTLEELILKQEQLKRALREKQTFKPTH